MQNRRFEIATFALLLAACALSSAACGNISADAAAGPAGMGDGGAGGLGNEKPKYTLEFVPGESITLKPKQPQELTISAHLAPSELDPTADTPVAPQFPIRLALSGDATADAVLNVSDVVTDADGLAHVTLTAPSKPTTFNVRASGPRASGDFLGITVEAANMTTLRVQPSYAGDRPIKKWTATAKASATCSDLDGSPPSDGNIIASAKPNDTLELTVPVGEDLAVTVRAGHYIGGCLNVPALSEGDGNRVLVYASDRALNLAATNLTLSMGATDAHPAFDKLLQSSVALAESALLGDAKSDIAALLDGMREASPSLDRDAFDAARTGNDWDSALETAFGKSAARRLRDPAQRWLTAGLAALDAPDALFGKLSPLNSSATVATFTPSSVGNASASDAGFPGFFQGKWSADSDDNVQLGMELNWEPSRLVTALALAPARAEFPDASSVEDALALSVDCAQVSQVLYAAGESPGVVAYASCDLSCAISACRSSVAAAWARAQESSGKESDRLSVTASAAAEVGDDARATALSGSWVGQLTRKGADAVQVSGALSAE